MKLLVFLIGVSCPLVFGSPKHNHTGYLHSSAKQIINKSREGGTLNHAQEGLINSNNENLSKYEVYEPQCEEEPYNDENSGRVFSGQREHRKQGIRGYGKGTYGHVGSGYKTEGRGIGDYKGIYNSPEENHGREFDKDRYGYNRGGGKDENRAIQHKECEQREGRHEKRGETNGRGEYNGYNFEGNENPKHKTQGYIYESGYSSGKSQNRDQRQRERTDQNTGRENGSGGLGDYSSEKHEDHKHKEPESTGEYGTHNSKDHKESNEDEGSRRKGEGGGLGEYTPGIYDIKKYGLRAQPGSGYDHGKYEGGFKSGGSGGEGRNNGYEVKEYDEVK